MSEKHAIIIILGSRKLGSRLATSLSHAADAAENVILLHDGESAQRKIQLVQEYQKQGWLAAFQRETLSDIEQDVECQLKTIKETGTSVAAILFMCSLRDTMHFPFKDDTRFLGLSGSDLFKKLIVVSTLPGGELTPRFRELSRKGMSVLSPKNRPDALLPRILTKFSSGTNINEIYETAAKSNRRHAKKAIILLVGHTGHGKSTTINRLVGQQLLHVGRGTLGSTTKVIQRVEVRTTDEDTAASVMVAFDDTPGLEDTTYEDRKLNAFTMRRYKDQYLKEIHPNVILLVASWDSITPDAHNEPAHLTSAVGKSMYSLYRSDLVDNERSNVVVVVTKSLSSFEDLKSAKGKSSWTIEAGRRTGIITDLQRKIFPQSPPWETVFIENGGGRKFGAEYPVLPNGQLSHQNLYEAIHTIIEHPGRDGSHDLVGIQALQVLTGARPLGSSVETEARTIVDLLSESELATQVEKPLSHSPEVKTREIVHSCLGFTYDVVRGTFGRTSVLKLKDLSLPLDAVPPGSQKIEFGLMTDADQQQSSHGSSGLDGKRLRAYYSSDWAFRSAFSTKLRCYILHHVTQVATVEPHRRELSTEMRKIISSLPTFSSESREKYTQFFALYGTHVITQVALGGVLRVIGPANKEDPAMVFRDGGASVASELTVLLERVFPPSNSSDWVQTSARWIKGLEKDPVFCPDHRLTEYEPIYAIRGLNNDQISSLKEAYKSYTKAGHEARSSNWAVTETMHDLLPRESNLSRAVMLLRETVARAFMIMKVMQ